MRFVVFDLEFTQPNKKILQIGAVTLDLQKNKIETLFDEICDPGELPNNYITELTGITSENVKEARPLREVLVSFWRKVKDSHCSNKMASWGQLDLELIKKSSEDYNLTRPHLKEYNIKNHIKIFRSMKGQSTRSGVGLKKVSESLDLDFVGKQHNAHDDAYQTARVFLKFYQEFSSSMSSV